MRRHRHGNDGAVIADRLGLDGRTVVVAGAGGGGIGTAISRVLSEAGATVAAFDVDAKRLAVAEQAVADAGGECRAMVVDVRDPEGLDEAFSPLPSPQALVHAAGGLKTRGKSLGPPRPKPSAAIVPTTLKPPFPPPAAPPRRLPNDRTAAASCTSRRSPASPRFPTEPD